MTYFTTSIRAIHPTTGKLTDFMGPNIPADNEQQAKDYCSKNMPWCSVIGELVSEIEEGEVDHAIDNLLAEVKIKSTKP